MGDNELQRIAPNCDKSHELTFGHELQLRCMNCEQARMNCSYGT